MKPLAYWYNLLEVALWPVIGLILVGHGLRRRGAVRRDCLIAAATLVLFGLSDWFEADNGNEWWHPWWLFLWKAACVGILLTVTVVAWRRTRSARRTTSGYRIQASSAEGGNGSLPAE